MSLQYDTPLRNNFNTQVISGVGASGSLNLYSGTMPANCAAALSGNNLLVSFTLSTSGFGLTSGGILSIYAFGQTIVSGSNTLTATVSASGTASFFRILTSGSIVKIQGTIAVSGADLNINNTSFVSGQAAVINIAQLTAPGA